MILRVPYFYIFNFLHFYILLFLVKVSTMYPNHTADENQRHCRHRHHTIVHIAEVVAGFWNNLEAQQRAATQQFTNGTYDHEDHGVAQAVAHTVEERGPRLVLHGKRLKATHEDTVSDDQTHIHAQLNAHVVGESLQDLRDDSHESREQN